MKTYHIHISGIVQGVGFRPYVHRLALDMNIKGWVSNGANGVHILCKGTQEGIEQFYAQIIQHPPAQAYIAAHSCIVSEEACPNNFHIRQSEEGGSVQMMLTPDMTLCDDCKKELNDPNNKRFHYPFITCVNCGPRYSITTKLPYDRAHTTMEYLIPCESCQHEYDDVKNSRHHSQTNSCPECTIPIRLLSNRGKELTTNAATCLQLIQEYLLQGKIIAVKGTGGYLLITDATSENAIALLRKRKARPAKPFAILYADIEMVYADLAVTPQEVTALKDKSSPIVLCSLKKEPANGIVVELIAPGLNKIGAMLPSSGLLQLIADQFGKPLVATSANLSGSPIIYEDDQAMYWLLDIADYVLSFKRDIVAPQDDSVVQFSARGQKIVLRRSRGLAPNYYPMPFSLPHEKILAVGAEIKSAFAIAQNNHLFISQFLGDQQSLEAQKSYQVSLNHISNLLDFRPEKILADKHPGYHSTQFGQELAMLKNCSFEQIQHHEAHFAAVLAENNLLQQTEPVLGFIWDGAGYGHDGHVWGGEVFTYREGTIERSAHLKDFPQLMGDKMNREPRLSAMSLLSRFPERQQLLEHSFTKTEWMYYQQITNHPQHLFTCSMGRLIDGVASILGVKQINTYEGEAAMQLETLAANCSYPVYDHYPMPLINGELDWQEMVLNILEDHLNHEPVAKIARKFFYSLTYAIYQTSKHFEINNLAFSGGVFQNKLLVDMIIEMMQHKYVLHFHHQLSPNDECIAFGQLAHASSIKEEKHPMYEEDEVY